MFGILLIAIGSFFGEVGASIGKNEVSKGREYIYTLAFLDLFWVVILFSLAVVFKRELFVFSFASLPTFSARLILEIIQVFLAYRGLVLADRSTFSFIRLLTIPLLLISDLVIGYALNTPQIIGVVVLSLALALVFLGKKINRKGALWVVLGAINAVATISLFKYDTTNFNSVAAEQLVIGVFLLVFFFFFTLYRTKANPVRLLFHKIFFAQSFSGALEGILVNYAYSFLFASVGVAIFRATSLLWSLLFGRKYFGEKHIVYKIFLILVSIAGLILLAV